MPKEPCQKIPVILKQSCRYVPKEPSYTRNRPAGSCQKKKAAAKSPVILKRDLITRAHLRAKEHLSERILTEVARDTEVRGWLPKIEIAKRPPSADRQLFTPSSKAPGAVARRSVNLPNGAQLTSSRVFQVLKMVATIAAPT